MKTGHNKLNDNGLTMAAVSFSLNSFKPVIKGSVSQGNSRFACCRFK
jgi:hypothetical protein